MTFFTSPSMGEDGWGWSHTHHANHSTTGSFPRKREPLLTEPEADRGPRFRGDDVVTGHNGGFTTASAA